MYLHMSVYTLLAVGIIAVAYLFALNYPLKLDLTKNRNFSLSPQSVALLKSLNEAISQYTHPSRISDYAGSNEKNK